MEALNKIFIRKLLKDSLEDVFYVIMADSSPTIPTQAMRRCQVSLYSLAAHLQVKVSFQILTVGKYNSGNRGFRSLAFMYGTACFEPRTSKRSLI
jgi:hypothetical protein